MKRSLAKTMAVVYGTVLALGAGAAAFADDTEIFFNQNNGTIPANVLFVLDTSGSMNDLVTTQIDYDPATAYAPNRCAAFDNNYYYYSNGGTPACGTANRILKTQFKCASMLPALNNGGFATDAFAQWGASTTTSPPRGNPAVVTTTQTFRWQNSISSANTTGYVECKADAGVHGDGVNNAKLYAARSTYSLITTTTTPPGTVAITQNDLTGVPGAATGVWDAAAANNYFSANPGGTYTLYAANYMNWLFDSTQSTTRSKMWIMRSAATSLLNSLTGVNVGLARYDYRGSGGMIMHAVTDIDAGTNRADEINLVQNWAPVGVTPLSETYFEAYRYFAGGAVNFGNASWSSTCTLWNTNTDGQCRASTAFAQPSVAASRSSGTINGTNYDSPADQSCRKNFIVYLTDGLPNESDQANAAIKALPQFATLGGSCDAASVPGARGGLCTGALAQYMFNADMRNDVAKVQNVTSYFIGFGNDFVSAGAPTAAFNYLDNAARRGGGKAYTADSLTGLTSAFNDILAEVMETNTTFAAPAVAVNAFNRTQTLNDLYVSVFAPRATFHWPGNVKKYKIVNGNVVDSAGAPAVDPNTGFFNDTARSYWSNTVDGADVTVGGAASKLPDAGTRTVYTYTGNTFPSPLTVLTAATVTDADLNIGGAADPVRTELVDWAKGLDTQNAVMPVGVTDSRHEMGDPVHTQPITMIYGKNGSGTDDTVVYVTTNDGYFHALDASANADGSDTATSGKELWSFIPKEMLPHLKDLYTDDPTTTKHYGLDGAISVLKYDINGDGTINGNDRVILFFGTGRNADTSAYYALDVTNKMNPQILWRINGSTLARLGQAWSTPVITRVIVAGATQNSQRLALAIGGGYDASEDNNGYNNSDLVGNRVYLVDALSGALLWSAGATGADFNSPRMTHAIPSPLSVLDLDGDGYADRIYVGDMAAQLWRFDITNGQPRGSLVAGGVIASLGTKDDAAHLAADVRRFYSAPDVSAEQKPGVQPFLNIAIGSGYRGHPLDNDVHDRFYSVRDYNGFASMTQAQFNGLTRIRDALSGGPVSSLLLDITGTVNPTMPSGALGWQLNLNTHPDWNAGEKSLVPSRTFDDKVIFTTYSPNRAPATDPCAGIGTGTNRVYVVDVFNGAPVLDRNKDGSMTTADRSQDLRQGGIAPDTAFLFTGNGSGSGGGGGGNGGAGSGAVTCLSGVEVLNVCTNFNQRRKTYWREGMAN